MEFAAASDATVTFGASGGTLKIDDAATFGGTIAGFRPGSLIDFGGFDDADMSHAHVYYDSDSGEVFFFHSVGEAPPDYVIDVGVVSTSVNHVLTDADFALLPDSAGGYSLAFNDFWIGGNGAAIDDPDNWSLGYVPDLNTAVTYNGAAILNLEPGFFQVAGLFLGTHADVAIVGGALGIGALDNSGTLTVTGSNTSLYLIGSFDNYGTFEANQGAQVYADGDITNEASGIFNVLDGASLTMVGTFTNYGTALVDPAVFEVQGDVHNFGTIEAGPDGVFHATGYVEGCGQFLICRGSMEFGGAVYSDVKVTFASSHPDKLILDDSSAFAGTLFGFGAGDQIVDRDGVLEGSFSVSTESGVVLHYMENGNVVSLALFGDYSSNNFAVSYSGGGIDIVYNQPPTIAAPATPVTDEDTPLIFGDMDKIALADPDTGELTVTLSADHGAISLSHLDGLNFSIGHGPADQIMTFSGSTAAINQALNGLTFSPDANYDGSAAAITVLASDGVGAPIEHVIDITINPVNDAPAIGATTSTGGLLSTGLTATAAGYLVASHDLINNLGDSQGHVTGFGENILSGNDDGSTGLIDIRPVFGSAGINFFGDYYKFLYVNNNGDITFGGPNATYTPGVITAGHFPIIAPFWADVDTRGGSMISDGMGHSTGSNLVYYDLDLDNHVMTITWDDVGYYNGHTDLANAFQLQLIGTGDGNFDIVMRYESINWTAGDASGGHDGLGGTTARAGYSAGDATHYYELPQSGNEAAMLALESNPGNTGIAGVDVFQVQSGNVSAAAAISGTIAFSDPDTSDTHSATVQARGEGNIGTFTLDDPNSDNSYVAEANGAGSVAWHFNLTSAETNVILSSAAATQTYDVTIADNHNATATQTVSISFGTNSDDTFHFNSGTHLGADTILNFNSSADMIVLEGYVNIPDHDHILVSSNSYGDAVIDLGQGDSITVAGVTQTDLQQHLDHILTV